MCLIGCRLPFLKKRIIYTIQTGNGVRIFVEIDNYVSVNISHPSYPSLSCFKSEQKWKGKI
ncbi:hypothetical protein BN1088_1433351 [Sphingobacterium sp. PM2-P1-29]|nr:hypothetical protein BN1088_1433351 [Sphingobacterium sp. PM2-P1-29]